jgi:hypothetical protein
MMTAKAETVKNRTCFPVISRISILLFAVENSVMVNPVSARGRV